jgi:GT2 family glycosyltransferase
VSVIIINYNGTNYLNNAVASMKRQTFRNFELIILDNQSSDGSAQSVDLAGLPDSRVILENENHGFARGNNIAVSHASGEWLVLMNPDTVAEPDWLERLMAAQARYPHVATFASCQHVLDAPNTLDGVGDAYLVFGFPWRGGFGHPLRDKPGEGEVFSPCGAGAMMRRSTFLAHGGFDERFFMYCEDVDLGFRLRLAGEQCIFVPDAVIHHAGSGISGRYSERTVYYGTRNRVWSYVKNMPLSLLIFTLPGHLAISAYLLVGASLRGRGGPTWRGMRDGFAQAGKMRRSPEFRWSGPPKDFGRLTRAMAWNPFRMSRRLPHVRSIH